MEWGDGCSGLRGGRNGLLAWFCWSGLTDGAETHANNFSDVVAGFLQQSDGSDHSQATRVHMEALPVWLRQQHLHAVWNSGGGDCLFLSVAQLIGGHAGTLRQDTRTNRLSGGEPVWSHRCPSNHSDVGDVQSARAAPRDPS